MKIAINCSYFVPKGGGIKEYIYNLLTNISNIDHNNEYVIYVAKDYYKYSLENLPKLFKIKKTPFSSNNPIKRSLLEDLYYLQEEKKEKFDIFHSPFFHAPKLKNATVIITVHDLRLYRYPKTYSLLRYLFLKQTVMASIRRADHIISISEFTKEEIIELCKVDRQKITVIYEAINYELFNTQKIEKFTPKLPIEITSGDFILAVGHIEPRKNYENLILAFNKFKNRNIKLVIVGKKDHGYKNVLNLIQQNNNIHYLNFVDTNTLLWLYKNTKLFVFPSFYEGFGFPPLEAAALGSISAVSKASCIPEICGTGALYFDPFNIDDILNVCESATENLSIKKNLQLQMKKNLNRFSWTLNAKKTLEVYNTFT